MSDKAKSRISIFATAIMVLIVAVRVRWILQQVAYSVENPNYYATSR